MIVGLIIGALAVVLIGGLLPIDLAALAALAILTGLGKLSTTEAFLGFSSPAIITMACTFVLAGSLRETGVTDRLAHKIGELSGTKEWRVIAAVFLLSAFVSAFMNNVVAAALVLPAVSRLAGISNVGYSRVFMPLAFGTIFGGMTTPFGTPPNIVAADILTASQHQGFHFFDFLIVGGSLAIAGLIVMPFLAKKTLPANGGAFEASSEETLTKLYKIDSGRTIVSVPADSLLVGKTLHQANLTNQFNVRVEQVLRGGKALIAPSNSCVIRAGDKLSIRGGTEKLGGLVELEPDVAAHFETDEIGLFEVVVAPRSRLVGMTLREVEFRQTYGFFVLGLWRAGEVKHDNLADEKLAAGDALLLQGPRSRFSQIQRNSNFVSLSRVRSALRKKKAPHVILAFLILAGLPLFGLAPIQVSALFAALLVVLSGATTMEEGYREIEWRVLIFTAAIMPIGVVLDRSGFTSVVADFLVQHIQSSPTFALTLLIVASSIVSQILDGAPAVVCLGPVALKLAQTLGVSPTPLVMGVALGASVAFLTPVSHKVNLLVMSMGGYRSRDYLKLGLPLTILVLVGLVVLIPIVMPF